MKDYIVRAKNLRSKEELKKVPTGIGYYKWYATVDDLKLLLYKLGITFESVPAEQWDVENGLYCIYLGIAPTSLRKRLNWHVNDKHTLSTVRSGGLSTLRQSLSAVLFSDESNEEGTNDFIDRLTIHYYHYDNLGAKSKENKGFIEKEETRLINEHLNILNDAKNYNQFKPKILRSVRKTGKTNGVRKLGG